MKTKIKWSGQGKKSAPSNLKN